MQPGNNHNLCVLQQGGGGGSVGVEAGSLLLVMRVAVGYVADVTVICACYSLGEGGGGGVGEQRRRGGGGGGWRCGSWITSAGHACCRWLRG